MSLLPRIAAVLLYASSLAWVWLYLYPIWQGCGFPLIQLETDPPRGPLMFPFFQHEDEREAPFRLLVLADPQLEGDTSLPDATAIGWRTALTAAARLDFPEVGHVLKSTGRYLRKRLDLWGNDRYLAHIYRSLQSFTYPTHVVVLGDLLGSQWIDDDEFERRADRFWNTVFAGSSPVPENLTRQPLRETLGQDESWKKRVIAVAGNHDVGYAGDMTESRMERFERRFGRANWEVEFELPSGHESGPTKDVGKGDHKSGQGRLPSVRIMVLNSMNLDGPAASKRLQDETYAALNDFVSRSASQEEKDSVITIVLTHVPLHKKAGVCIDGPMFNYYPSEQGSGLREQNHLGEHPSRHILEGVFGFQGDVVAGPDGKSKGRQGLVLNGHDHEGCDTWHYLPSAEALAGQEDQFRDHRWNATRWRGQRTRPARSGEPNGTAQAGFGAPGLREVTLRAMMGEFEGNAAFVSAWWDAAAGQWGYNVGKCAAGSQHVWWAIHVLFIITTGVCAVALYNWQAAAIRLRSIRAREHRAAKREKKAAAARATIRRR